MAETPEIPALRLENIGRYFSPTAALEQVSLSLQTGEIACLLGRSGCGKSSLLRLISGVDKPDAGRIFLAGEEVAGPGRFVEPERRNVGFMFQDYALFPHLTVAENIGFGLKTMPRAQAHARVAEVMKRIGISALAPRYPHTLSGGEQQRVALARALAPRPVLLLMDEPFSNLDRALRESLREETFATLRSFATTAIMVTHDPEEALSSGDRVVLMKQGRIVQDGTGYDVYDRPATLHAAEFLSTGSAFTARCQAGRAETPLGAFSAPEGAAEGEEITVFVRPRALAFAPEGEGFAGRLLSRAFLGEREQFTVAVEGVGAPLRLLSAERHSFRPGEILWLSVRPQAILTFRNTPGDHANVS